MKSELSYNLDDAAKKFACFKMQTQIFYKIKRLQLKQHAGNCYMQISEDADIFLVVLDSFV